MASGLRHRRIAIVRKGVLVFSAEAPRDGDERQGTCGLQPYDMAHGAFVDRAWQRVRLTRALWPWQLCEDVVAPTFWQSCLMDASSRCWAARRHHEGDIKALALELQNRDETDRAPAGPQSETARTSVVSPRTGCVEPAGVLPGVLRAPWKRHMLGSVPMGGA